MFATKTGGGGVRRGEAQMLVGEVGAVSTAKSG
jgi:hypothetical protein